MIVKCERCQTRFKIPDEKVTDKGVKVRCTKCQNTFRVSREAAAGEAGVPPAPSPSGEADPFAPFGVAPDPRHVEITKPGFFAQGVEATRASPARPPSTPWNSVDGDLDTGDGVFHEPTRVGPVPLPPAARPQMTPFDAPGAEGAVPLPAPVGAPVGPPRPMATGLYGSAVPPSETQGAHAPGGAVPLPGAVAAVPLPGVAGPRSAPPAGGGAPAAPGRVPPAGTPGGAAPASVTMFGPQKAGAPAAGALRAGQGGGVPLPPPVPDAVAAPPGMAAPAGGPPPHARRAAPAPSPAAPPSYELGGPDPFADLLGAPGASAPPTSAGAFDLLPSPKAPGGAPPGLSAAPRGPAASAPAGGAFDLLPSPKAPAPVPPGAPGLPASHAADALRRAAAPPTSAPTGAAAMGPMRPAPAAAPASFEGEDPFGSIDIDDATVTDIRPTSPAPPVGEDPFGSIDVEESTVTAVHAPPPQAAPALAPARAPAKAAGPASSAPLPPPPGEDPFASIDLGGPSSAAPAARPAAPVPPAAQSGRAPASSAPADSFDLTADADPFGEHAGMQPTDTGRAALLGTPPPASDGFNDLSAPTDAGTGSLLADIPPVEEAQEFSVTLGKIGVHGAVEVLPDLGSVPAAPAVTVARPTARPEDVGIPQSRPPSRARKVTALIANLVVAAVLVVAFAAVGRVYLREGRVDLSVLSPDSLRTLIVPSARPLVALDVTNALYDTKSGRPLFIVRGEAENRSGAATRIRVRAALFDGSQRVRSAEALAGTLPTPEELYAIGNLDAATALSQRLDAAATAVAPGAKVPFLVVFQEYPADLGGFRLEVTLEPVPAANAEAGGRTE
ncbi:zinc-ribbon domain-containing protein [Pyxidicoccus parkwayensis]|uniref:Zinc-ribbon domain-containing protein n=1 Tax=Pyxidicoccus parkwayensis TaxID=2813578 RepID=A0ABX7NY40_9BACT|nr:zinc-ribbon domain-containing protein [Pyxidicoccus parkwaysis]QSQ23820.1 zinc-ribbon domain-containing protein [Pyxidicoccus parkwaysis]